jgi:uncharacterized protein (DUF1778 family)
MEGMIVPRAALQTKSRGPNVRAQVPEEIKQRWQSAAAMRGQTLTDFLIVAVNNAADEIFDREEKIRLSQHDQMKLAEMLLDPPEINEAMKGLLTRYKPQLKKS